MRAIPIVLAAALAAACSAPTERPGCSASTDCPVGQYCASTPDGNVCWPDAVPPTVSAVTVTCASPCLRDSELTVAATITDDTEVLDAQVTLDLGGPAVPLARAGSTWSATLPLRSYPFDFFSHGVVATVTARDGARNSASLDAAGVTTVTRLRWSESFGASLASPAVNSAGLVAVPGNNGRVYFSQWDGQFVGSVEVGAGIPQAVTPPTVVGTSFWVGADDGNVYELTDSGSWSATTRASTGAAISGPLASTSAGTIVAASGSGVLYAVTSTAVRNGTLGLPFTAGPVIDVGDAAFAVASGSVRRFTFPLGIPTDAWGSPATITGIVADPIACTTAMFVASRNASNGVLNVVGANGDPAALGTTALPSGGIALLADGSVLVPEQTKTLSRWTSTGTAFPGWQKPDLGAATRTPLVVTGAAPFVVSTARGAVYALRPDGSIAWTGQLGLTNAALQPGNIYTPPGEPQGQELSTAFFAGSDGWLHAVIVDGKLDPAAPWPKAFHDTRNSNRAGAPIP